LHKNPFTPLAQRFFPFAAKEVHMPLRMMFAISNILMLLIGNTAALENPEIRESAQLAQLENKDLSQPDITIKSKVALVSLDAIVRNSKGEFIGDLQKSDFKIYDEGIAQEVSLFSHDYKPLDIALIIDASGSEQKYRSRLREAALGFLQQLNPNEDRVALFCFGMYPIQLTGLALDRSLIIGSIDRIPETEGSNITDALWDATQYLSLQPKGHRRAIILISDNFEQAAPISSGPDMLRPGKYNQPLVQELLEADVTLISIKTPGKKTGRQTYTNVSQSAADTGGEALDANSLDALSYSLNSAVLRLKSSYGIGFYPSDERSQGSFHNLKITLDKNKCPSCKIWARKGYYAGGQAIAASDNNDRRRISTPLQPRKYAVAYAAPYFGQFVILSMESPQILLMNEGLTKITGKITQYSIISDDYRMPLFSPISPNAPTLFVWGSQVYVGTADHPYLSTGQYAGVDPSSPHASDFHKLAYSIENAPITSQYVSQRYLTGLKMLWTDLNRIAVSDLFSYLFEQNQKPKFNDFRKRLNFQILANRSSEVGDKQVTRIDLECDAKQLFFFFNGERYKTWLVLASKYGEKSKSVAFIKFYEQSYSEEEFMQILQSGIPLSFTMEIPKEESKVRLMVFNPIMSIYDIKDVDVQQ
jgi:Ca-activated chloride channel homolog